MMVRADKLLSLIFREASSSRISPEFFDHSGTSGFSSG